MSPLVLGLFLGCASTPVTTHEAASEAIAEAEPEQVEEIEETTVGLLNGHRVPMGNMIPSAEYTLPDGSTQTGTVASLAIDGNVGVFVGLGSVVTVGDDRWEVVGIEKPEGDLGWIRLKRLP